MLLAFAVCALCGQRMAGRLQTRKHLLTTLAHDMETLAAAALRTRRPLGELLGVCSIAPQTQALLQHYCEQRTKTSHKQAWTETAAQHAVALTPLQADETAALAETLQAFTAGDQSTLQKQSAALQALLRERSEAAAKDAKEKGKLYRSVGLLLGAAVAVIMM